MGLWEDVTDTERPPELRLALHGSGAQQHRQRALGMAGTEPGQMSPGTPGVMCRTRGAAASPLIPL